MTILLDSHVFFWWATGNRRLSSSASAAIEAEPNVCISPVVAWEITTKVRSGKWPEAQWLAERFFEVMERYSFTPLALTIEHAHLAGSLPALHRDPFDRLLAAQAQIEDIPLVTADPAFRAFDVRVLW